jgi:hypothetical protein
MRKGVCGGQRRGGTLEEERWNEDVECPRTIEDQDIERTIYKVSRSIMSTCTYPDGEQS